VIIQLREPLGLYTRFHVAQGPPLMRLLNVTQSYFPFMDKGGPTVKVRALARGMTSKGHTVAVLTADHGLDAAKREALHAVPNRWGYETKEDGVDTTYLQTRAQYRSLTWNPGISGFCRDRLDRFDVSHIFGLYDLLGPKVAKACRKIGQPYLLEPMGMFRPIVRNLQLKRVYHQLLGDSMIGGASRVIATSEQEREEFLEGGITSKKIVVRRNGIDVPDRFPPAGQFRKQWNISSDAKLILFLGRLVSKKSPDLMLEAYSRWRRSSRDSQGSVLVVAGPDEGDGYRQRLETLAAQMGLSGGVKFTGPLYEDAKWAAYRDADLFVLPSQNENFGNTAAEAVACGTPVLVTDRCGIAPIVDGRAGLVVAHDCAALQAGLARILDDSAFAAHLRTGCEEVTRSLGWGEPLAQMETLFQELASERCAA
jgi:glycosyltransferase involved in cell wall biosynthesis